MPASPGHVLVVGAGVFGSAAALALRSRGWDVTLLDPGPLPHERASSTDVSKVVRMDYGSDVFYHELAEAALDGWDRWNAEWPRPLYHEDGFLILSRGVMAPGTFEHESWRVLRERGYEPSRLGVGSLAGTYPAWRSSDYTDGYLSTRAGWAESGAVVARLVKLGADAGVRLRAEAFGSLIESGSRIGGVVTRAGERLEADRVVVCAGAWTPTLLPWLADRLWATAQPVVYLGTDVRDDFRGAGFPPWAADIANSGWYGFPALDDGRIKIGHHGQGTKVAPDARPPVGPGHVARLRAFLLEAIPALADAPVVGERICLYCDAFDGDFLIDQDPEREGLVVAAGGSGHGFKFAPLLGGLVADALERRHNSWAARFQWREAGEARTEEARYGGG